MAAMKVPLCLHKSEARMNFASTSDRGTDRASFALHPMDVASGSSGRVRHVCLQRVRADSGGCRSARAPSRHQVGFGLIGSPESMLYIQDIRLDRLGLTRQSSRLRDVQSASGHRFKHRGGTTIMAQAMEAMEEALYDETKGWNVSAFQDDMMPPSLPLQQPLPLPPKNRADDLSLMNPLKRLERMGCGWLSVVFEWEGVIVEDDAQLERKAWAALAEEEGRSQPLAFMLKRAEGMKNEQVISEVLCWTRDFLNMKRLARRKEELYEEMQGGVYRMRPGSKEFVETLKRYKIPVAVASTRPRKYLERAIEAVGMEGVFDVVVAAEDAYRGKPDPEMYQYASQLLGFIPERCIVIGNSNKTIEAAHDALMKVVAVVGIHPAYELGAADLVVRRLDELSLVDLKNLSDLESPEFQPPEVNFELEPEEEEDVVPLPKLAFKDDDFW